MAEQPTAEERAGRGAPAAVDVSRDRRALHGLVVDRGPIAQGRPTDGTHPTGPNEAGTPATHIAAAKSIRLPRWVREGMSCLVSLAAHMVVLLALGLWVIRPELPDRLALLQIAPTTQEEQRIEEMLEEEVPGLDLDPVDAAEKLMAVEQVAEEQDFALVDDMDAAAVRIELSDLGALTAPKNDLLRSIGALQGNALKGRAAGARAVLARSGGGTTGSEEAVTRALKWLESHQNGDGSWSLDHRLGSCQGRCPNPGIRAPALNAATALALLPFLGAGQTHKEGKYTKTVGAGIYFLVRSMQVANGAGSLHEPGGSMYAHGLASIVLCEAYAMTGDRALAGPAQMALNYIVAAQDPVGGGWRYEFRQPGDTSVLGWQVMALKSGHMAYLDVPPATIKKASRFLDSVQREGGAFYGYVGPGKSRRFGTTAIGLLCRMYMGWKQDNEALERGIDWIGKHGPATMDFYGNYYAMQLMFQFTGGKGPLWEKWNTALRDDLVALQATEGHADGSWFLPTGHSNESGGRLYCTSMATMMLEVYYRHLPLYGKQATEEDFPL